MQAGEVVKTLEAGNGDVDVEDPNEDANVVFGKDVREERSDESEDGGDPN